MDTFQDVILKLKQYWSDRGCIIQEPHDIEVGAGTMSPETFLRVLGPRPYRVAYVQPSRRPSDGRYGENPNRLYKHWQLQVILKPAPADVVDQYLGSLAAIGIDLRKHDIKFEEDNWESPTLGAWGIGWQVMLDGLEVTQFTYFQQCGGIDLDLVPAELTYGMERLTAFLQNKSSVYDIEWAPGFTYGDVRLADEVQFSVYNFEMADVATLWKLFELNERECQRLLNFGDRLRNPEIATPGAKPGDTPAVSERANLEAASPDSNFGDRQRNSQTAGISKPVPEIQKPVPEIQRFPVLPAYDYVLKCSHLFNLLDSRGAISVTERVAVIGRVRKLALGVARLWLEQQGAAAPPEPVAQEVAG